MLPEVRVIIERAATARFELEGLIEVVPEPAWEYPTDPEGWLTRTHLEQIIATDRLTAELGTAAAANPGDLWVGGVLHPDHLEARLEAERAQFLELSVAELRQPLREERDRLAAALGELVYSSLDRPVHLPGHVDAWGVQRALPLRQYLNAWLQHEPQRIAAIRAAIAKPPDMSAVAIGMRVGRRRP